MSWAIFGTTGTAFAALTIWLLVRVIDKRESLVMAIAVLTVVGSVGMATAILLAYLLSGC